MWQITLHFLHLVHQKTMQPGTSLQLRFCVLLQAGPRWPTL